MHMKSIHANYKFFIKILTVTFIMLSNYGIIMRRNIKRKSLLIKKIIMKIPTSKKRQGISGLRDTWSLNLALIEARRKDKDSLNSRKKLQK